MTCSTPQTFHVKCGQMKKIKLHRFCLAISTRSLYVNGQQQTSDESNGFSLLAEALATEIEAVFTDKTSLMGAEAAVDGCTQLDMIRRTHPAHPANPPSWLRVLQGLSNANLYMYS